MAKFDIWNSRVDLEEKALREEDDCFRLTGYAATYDEDRIGDIIVPGAFKKSLDRRAASGDNVQLFYNHKIDEVPIGNVVKCFEDKKGLRYEAELPKDDTFVATRIVPQIKRRSLKANSFGFKIPAGGQERRKDGKRLLKEIDLWEISVVNNPCNTRANIEGVKGLVGFQDLPVDLKSANWDAAAALTRVTAHFAGNCDELKSAFLYVDEEKQATEWEPRLLVADIVDGKLVANRVALYKANAALLGARGGVQIPEDAVDAVKSHIARYFDRIGVEAPEEKLSVAEYDALDVGEREVRLKSLGISQSLAKKFVSGQRDADRRPNGTSGQSEEATALLNAFAAMAEAARATANAISPKQSATGK